MDSGSTGHAKAKALKSSIYILGALFVPSGAPLKVVLAAFTIEPTGYTTIWGWLRAGVGQE